MANQEQLKILKQGVKVWNKWRKNNLDMHIDFGDFLNWMDKSSYQKAFERLLRDLKATGG